MIPAARLFAGQSLFADRTSGGGSPSEFSGIARDSRAVARGAAFVAVGSDSAECSLHARAAHAAGATVAVAEDSLPGCGPTLLTAHARWSFARASAAASRLDEQHAPLVGVTGSAGKSTIAHCAWWALGAGAGRVGTLGWHDGVAERPGKQTTPPPEELHRFLAALPATCPGVAIEISSHAGDQQRLAGLELSGLAFTGLGHDHLDYHRTIAAYLAAKLKIVRWLRRGALCMINADDARAAVVGHAALAVGARPLGLGFAAGEARIEGDRARGWRLRWEGADHPLPVLLPGAFNAWNAAAGALLAHAAGVPISTALARLADLPAVPGRLELLARAPLTYVDYAHTPEAITALMTALRGEFPGQRLVCVFGCGGDRDRSKRGPMGRAALAADLAVLTTDNSRSESPAAIADEVIAGLPAGTAVHADGAVATSGLVVELDRARAILLARRLAGRDGVVVVVGKGHETSQEIQGRVLPWDDRAFVAGLEASHGQ